MAFDARKAIVQRFFDEAFVRFRGDEMPYLVTPDFRCDAWKAAGIADGPDGASCRIDELREAFSQSSARIESISDEGELMVVRYVFEADQTGPFGGRPARGRRVSGRGDFTVRMEGCRIAELRRPGDVRELGAPADHAA